VIPGSINFSDIKGIDHSASTTLSLKDYFKVGQVIRAKILEIKPEYRSVKMSPNINKDDFRDFLNENGILRNYNLIEHKNFRLVPDEDFSSESVLLEELQKMKHVGSHRVINYQFYRRWDLNECRLNLQKENSSDVSATLKQHFIRPKDDSTLILTWRVYKDIILNEEIKEGARDARSETSKDLFLRDQIYHSLEAISTDYVTKIQEKIKQITQSSHFINRVEQSHMEQLKSPTAANAKQPLFFLRISQEAPGKGAIVNLSKKKFVQQELFEIQPDQFCFHDQKFYFLPEMISWMKANIKSDDYEEFYKTRKNMRIISSESSKDGFEIANESDEEQKFAEDEDPWFSGRPRIRKERGGYLGKRQDRDNGDSWETRPKDENDWKRPRRMGDEDREEQGERQGRGGRGGYSDGRGDRRGGFGDRGSFNRDQSRKTEQENGSSSWGNPGARNAEESTKGG
jgi:hypothetical protein